MSTPPQEWFKVFEREKYTQFDANGLPTHAKIQIKKDEEMVDGEKELSKEIKNKLQKEWNN